MKTAVLVTMWWFLATPTVKPYTSWAAVSPSVSVWAESTGRAFAVGPFPTEEMCLKAENLAEPSNQQFWTVNQRAKWDADMAKAKASEQAFDTYEKALIVANPKRGHLYRLVPDGPTFFIDHPPAGVRNPHLQSSEYAAPYFCDGNKICVWWGEQFVGGQIPTVTDEPRTAADQYHVEQACASVKGWYESK